MTPAERQARRRARRGKSINRRRRTLYKIAKGSERKHEKRRRREVNLAGIAPERVELVETAFGRIPRCNIIVVDFPSTHVNWSFETGSDRAPENAFATMGLERIAAFPLLSICADNCIAYMWTPNDLLLDFGDILRHRWGFRYSQSNVWAKDTLGLRKRERENGEFILVGLRGNMPAPLPEDMLPYVFQAPRNRQLGQSYSPKPSLLAEHIDKAYSLDAAKRLVRIELFARPKIIGDRQTGLYTPLALSARFRPGWWHWGDDVPGGLLYVPP